MLSDVSRHLGAEDLYGVYRQMGAVLRAMHRIGQERFRRPPGRRPAGARATNDAYMADRFAKTLRQLSELG